MPYETADRFQRLIWPLLPTVLRTARYLCRNAAEAEDLAQETLLKAYRALDTLREGSDPKAWVMAILRNTRIDRLRSAGSHPTTSLTQLELEPELKETLAATDADALWQDPDAALAGFSDPTVIDALRELPEEIRWTLLLVDVEGLDLQEAAEILKVPLGTVKSRCHRGRGMLRVRLLEHARAHRMVPERTGSTVARVLGWLVGTVGLLGVIQ